MSSGSFKQIVIDHNHLSLDLPSVVTQLVIQKIESDRRLAHGSIMGDCRQSEIVRARYDAIAYVYTHFQQRGRKLTLQKLEELFNRDHSTISYALKVRGLK